MQVNKAVVILIETKEGKRYFCERKRNGTIVTSEKFYEAKLFGYNDIADQDKPLNNIIDGVVEMLKQKKYKTIVKIIHA